MTITVSIVEDDRPTRESLVALLAGKPSFRCLNTYANAAAALAGIPRDRPDVAIVDINLPGMSGIECVAKLKAAMPALLVLMLTTYEDSEAIFESLRAGANGYLLKKSLSTELIGAIEEVQTGGAPLSVQVARKVVAHFHRTSAQASEFEALTTREQEILALLAKGHLYKQIADRLGISFSTVRAHVRNIYGKLQVQSRTEATLKFLERH
jgi:DNA-binding NarL/FixJ family response regulator